MECLSFFVAPDTCDDIAMLGDLPAPIEEASSVVTELRCPTSCATLTITGVILFVSPPCTGFSMALPAYSTPPAREG